MNVAKLWLRHVQDANWQTEQIFLGGGKVAYLLLIGIANLFRHANEKKRANSPLWYE